MSIRPPAPRRFDDGTIPRLAIARLGLALLVLGACGRVSLAQTNFAVLAGDGAWTWYNDPRALFHHGILYFGYVRNADGRTALSAFNPQTGQSTDLWVSNLTQKDDHNNPGLLVKQDGTLLAIHARHGTDQFFSFRHSTSTNPVTAADWTAEQTIPATGAGLTYANPYQLSAEGGKIYDFTRDLNFNPTVLTSTNGGSTWSAPQWFIKTGTGSIRPYVKYCADDARRIDFLYTDGHPNNITNSLYHLYYQGETFYRTDGALVKGFAGLPILHDSGERGSVIYQYSTTPTNDPNAHIPTGRAWCWEVAYQTNGSPVCVFTVQRDQVMGANWFDDRIYYYYARWTGTNWQKRFIARAGRPLYSSERDYAGGICLDPADPSTVYLSSNAQEPFDLSNTTNVLLRANDRYELFRGVTRDGGLTFTWQPVTTNSAKDNLRPYIPRRQSDTPAVIWFRGAYSTYTSYNCEIVGLFPSPVPQPPTARIVKPAASRIVLTNLNNELKLETTAADDGLPGPLQVAWTTVRGPAHAVFAEPVATNTTVRFPVSGTYVLRLTASDSVASASADITVHAGSLSTDGPDATRVLWLKLDELAGTSAADSSGGGNSGTVAGGVSWQPAGGTRGGAAQFDGASGVITVPDAPAFDRANAFTLAYWFRADAYPADSAGLVSKRDSASANNAYTTYLKTSDKRIYVDIEGSDNRFASATLVNTGLWYHVALAFDGSLPTAERAKLWINGALDITAAETSAAVADHSSHFRVGSTPASVPAWFTGAVDDVRFHRRALGADEISTLSATNAAPGVAFAPSGSVTNGVATLLTAHVADDGRGGPLSVEWETLAGMGNALFGNRSATTTTVTFDAAGDYLLRLSADDTQVEVCADLALNVHANPNLYEDWIAAALPGSTNATQRGPEADADGDGAKNLLEFALGMDPALPDARPFAADQAGLPAGAVEDMGGVRYLVLRARRPVGRMGIQTRAECSGDLLAWTDAVAAGPPTANSDGTELITFRDVVPVSESNTRFMRLKVIRL